MPRPTSKTIFALIPSASQSSVHYSYLFNLLLKRGHPFYPVMLPSKGSSKNVTIEDDAKYVREQILLPVLDIEEGDVILIMHSYSGIPGSAAALGLGKAERAAAGKKTSVLGQIYIASLLIKGGDGGDIIAALGGKLPPHIVPKKAARILTREDPAAPLHGDVTPKNFQDDIVMSTLCPSYASWHSPCPRASWGSEDFKGRVAFVRTLMDKVIPLEIQDMMIKGTGEEWIVKDIDTGNNPNLSAPGKICDILEELGRQFESL
ncbi:439899bb-e233-4b6e-9a4d-e8f03737a0c9 [Sclerotinia trifoliorum]|uniref:439899bb-e233-4b6e-9a4d-e8f03737a0c9 n=1 Tax=Sclerotinia trifoliorum TaxID=28548 RepID=A0A8H2VW18_9HELO|nr:439899bb-e233-4b6e-9a4d-e8f03737a0c9 [Sclerotinia trifoliorum]